MIASEVTRAEVLTSLRIHSRVVDEIYFPYVLSQPALIIAANAGGVVGTFTFTTLGAGLTAVASPGSIISILLLTPQGIGNFLAVLAGVLLAAIAAFGVAALILVRSHQPVAEVAGKQHQQHAIREIIITGTQGMGTPQMAVALLQAKLQALNDITISVKAEPISALKPDSNACLSHGMIWFQWCMTKSQGKFAS